ncbi:cystathionine beta-lyase [Pontibacillus halophilus JSM 076056 = DSM 19796]|uniref:cysteine-S-conjugate beta-lyase n=1 Tax=Pontibacillus halophilus JSM 076056 = DSM 19796 TaxID=1385510 RepID=A0A0A5GEG0_9BACI|nr:PatB family C-S lyase [Pontibacillus halophilus]KGX89603.1 cystathionine beta-lyase [Pontibacillus halophilus JSM 076056 = DSM 19796]
MSRFTEIVDRTQTRSVKWDLVEKMFENQDVLPMWVADMDFKAPEAVIDALTERAQHGVFGYTVPDEYVHGTIQKWLSAKHDWNTNTDWLTYSPGVVPSLHTIVEALTNRGDSILIQTPVYPPFYSVIEDHEREILKNPLVLREGRYEIDFTSFEEELKKGVSLFILCNPHNPVGRVWTEEELRKMADLCLMYNVPIVSDEIHSDLIYRNHKHVPIASLSEDISKETITLLSPTKTFNLAGIQGSYIVTPDEHKKEKIDRQFGLQGIKMLNVFAITALEAAYTEGDEWLQELIDYLEGNKQYVIDTISTSTDKIKVIEPEGTYLIWLDCRGLGLEHEELKHFMQHKAKVGLNDGASFGEEGEGFMRINIACPRATLEEGIRRITEAL